MDPAAVAALAALSEVEGDLEQSTTVCRTCGMAAQASTSLMSMPGFRDGEVAVTTVHCILCGARSNDVIPSGELPTSGVRVSLQLNAESAWATRRVVKGMHCTVSVPELGLELSAATLGGCVLEAKEMLDTIHSQLSSSGSVVKADHLAGSQSAAEGNMVGFLERMQKVIDGDEDATLVLEDPSGCTFIEGPDGDKWIAVEEIPLGADFAGDAGDGDAGDGDAGAAAAMR